MSSIVLIKTGSTIPQAQVRFGDFEDWFKTGTGVDDLNQINVYLDQELPLPDDPAGVIITGSGAMVSEREDWSERTARWLKDVVKANVPVLGVCYGHQLLAHALGGRVGPNPNGRQIGTVTARLLEIAKDDPLLDHLPTSFPVQTSHQESVLELPQGATRLAISPRDDNFVIRFAERTWGLQYHPEFSASVMSEYIRARSETLAREGLDSIRLLAELKETPKAHSVLRKFIDMVIK